VNINEIPVTNTEAIEEPTMTKGEALVSRPIQPV